ncbi:MAG: right-handed parallel beta-helix repeat-containing protein [Puniceicoccaceae bacterium]
MVSARYITRICSVFFLAIALLPLASQARDYHVTKSGNDSDAGTIQEPLKTIQAAAELAMPGDVVIVHEGEYRERINPPRGGLSDLQRITYKAADGEKVIIKGSEVVKGWERLKGSTWKVSLPNSFFGDYNPFDDLLEGDWLNKKGFNHHTGEVFLNGIALFEKNSIEEVLKSEPYPDARNQEESVYTWFSEVNENSTTIWANFQDLQPNDELVEISARPACFYPDMPGRNYITVSGFVMTQAATQWAAPTAEQPGLIGTHWSKGWIIENNTVSNSKSVGITLGKERGTGQNVWMHNPVKDGATHYNEVIFRALEIGWSKEKIGSHIVRNNEIFRCGQAGIVGSLGGVFSEIYGNHIHDIWIRRIFSGAEMAGIKIHASIDMLISQNRIHNTGRGIWIDWMAQGTRVTQNLLYDNTTDDLFSEVNHGPYLVDNNILLSDVSLRDWSEGGAFVHNLIAGKIRLRKVENRFTPYHLPHSTKVAGLRNNTNGDDRFFNNVFVKTGEADLQNNFESEFYGLELYKEAGYGITAEGNVHYNGATPYEKESNFVVSNYDPGIKIEEVDGSVLLHFKPDDLIESLENRLITTEILGTTIVSECIFEQPDGTPYLLDKDYFGDKRTADPVPGPFRGSNYGKGVLKVW